MRSICPFVPTLLALLSGCLPLAAETEAQLDDSGAPGGGALGDSADSGDRLDTGEANDSWDTGGGGSAPATLAELFALLGPEPTAFTIADASVGGAIAGDSVHITIGPKAFSFSDGRLAGGAVDVELTEYDSLGDMVRGGRATLTADGDWLATSGSFALKASQEGQPLAINGITDLAFDAWDSTASGMELFVAGDAGEAWTRPLEEPATATLVRGKDGSGDNAFQFSGVWAGGIGGYSAYNCDAITNLSAVHVTLDVVFLSHFSTEAAVFFLPAGASSAVQLYTGDSSLPGYRSYMNGMPVGITGKLVIYSLIDGERFLFHDDAYTIPVGVDVGGGEMKETLSVDLLPTSEADFNAYLNGL
ncbi:hypothetical protein LBMAG42_21980 [Deltaproteobacteria bacterium]|nr:hypothetical protein LBMAG42_21980 [Deltaproteobacteria bacterium]